LDRESANRKASTYTGQHSPYINGSCGIRNQDPSVLVVKTIRALNLMATGAGDKVRFCSQLKLHTQLII